MQEQIAKIRTAKLGYEDHGIFAAALDFDYGGSGQGVLYALDTYSGDNERVGTASGLDFIIRVVQACGVSAWDEVAGKTVIALREDGYNGRVVGIKPLPTEGGKPFMFDEAFVTATR